MRARPKQGTVTFPTKRTYLLCTGLINVSGSVESETEVESNLFVITPALLNMSIAESVAKFERKIIRMALTQNQFSIVRTAKQLKLTRHGLRYRMQKLGLNIIRSCEDSGEENNGRI